MTLFCDTALFAIVSSCFAYVGPGPGLSMTWALVGLLATILAAVSAIALWPVRALFRRLRQKPQTHCNEK
jgi:hypothetical protein